MKKLFAIQLISLVVALFALNIVNAQDSTSLVEWQVSSEQKAEGTYLLKFSASLQNGWQVYAPGQVLLDGQTATIKFSDSNKIITLFVQVCVYVISDFFSFLLLFFQE